MMKREYLSVLLVCAAAVAQAGEVVYDHKAFGHRNARYVELPLANHRRACSCGLPYLELFIRDGLPADLEVK